MRGERKPSAILAREPKLELEAALARIDARDATIIEKMEELGGLTDEEAKALAPKEQQFRRDIRMSRKDMPAYLLFIADRQLARSRRGDAKQVGNQMNVMLSMPSPTGKKSDAEVKMVEIGESNK